ncbi:ATP-dependent DNA ligase [Candidatus Woesearchaeota archaeon]|nr:ATP-dependent DNA ligase [Candidatus Woesearchaeota archaeon]
MEYNALVEVYEALDSTSKRLEKTHIISEFLKKVPKEDIATIMLLLEGRLFPRWDSRELGVASRLVIKAISSATGIEAEKVEKEWKKAGDLGNVAENLIKGKKQATLFSSSLSVRKVFSNLQKLATLEGHGSVDKKIGLISELLTSATPKEAKYITRTLLQDMRIGVGEGSLRDAIVWAFFGDKVKIAYNVEENDIQIEDREEYNKYVGAVQKAYDATNDFGPVAEAAKSGLKALEKMELSVGIPIKVMLALKVDNAKEGLERVGKPAEAEYKYDGFRIQAHKKGNDVKLFTRKLEDVTMQFPEAVSAIKKNIKAKEAILDSEAVGYSKASGKYLPFQSISQRIKRKYDIEKMASDFPVEVNVFDIIYYDGKSFLDEPFEERKKVLKKIVSEEKKRIVLAKSITTSDEKEIENFYNEAIEKGNEGLMLKKLDAPYRPGARVGYMVKYKKYRETFDLAVVGAEWGEGKRTKWLSSYIIACAGEDGELLEVGRVSTGLKEKDEEGLSFNEMTKILKPLVISEKGKEARIKPKIIIEVGYEEIQKSPTYSSGYALRFPRVICLREEKSLSEITTLEQVEEAYGGQKK